MKLKSEPVTLESLHDDCVALEEKLYKTEAQRDALLAAAKECEWLWIQGSMVQACPSCGGTKIGGHGVGCKLHEAIQQAESE